MFGRETRTQLPDIPAKKQCCAADETARRNDELAKFNMKKFGDAKNRARHSTISRGDTVLLQNEIKENKLTPAYGPKPYTVVDVKGNMVKVRSNEREVTRNSSVFKKIKQSDCDDNIEFNIEEDDVPNPSKELPVPSQNIMPKNNMPERKSERIRRKPKRLEEYVLF